jgi:hypothetical protein
VLPVHCVAYVGRAGAPRPPRVKREQKALPFPPSNARRQLSALQPGPYSRVAEPTVDVCRVVPEEVVLVIEALLDEEELV